MLRLGRWLALTLLLVPLGAPSTASGQVAPPLVTADPCPEPNQAVARACRLGQPNGLGVTVQGLFQTPDDVDAYRFEVPAGGAQAYVSLTDLWYEGSLRLYDVGRDAFVADSDRQGQTQGQWRAPEVIVRWLEPGSYAAFVLPGQDDWQAAEAHSYTLRVALGPRLAPTAAPGPAPAAARGYQLTLAIEPNDPGPFSLMTFTATLSPPFTDLFDFTWTVDGQPYGDNSAVVQLGRPASGTHSVQVVARGARYYPDLTLPEFPPTLSTSGTFRVP